MHFEFKVESRPYLSYSGVKLPLKLVEPLSKDQLQNRNTYFLGYYDKDNRLMGIRKMVYAEIEFEHRYCYDSEGRLSHVTITNNEGDMLELDDDQIN